MKKVFLGIGLLLLLLLGALIAVPLLFKDKIKVILDRQIANTVNADVRYKPENVDLTIFRSFPSLTLAIDELAIIGQDTFARDTLAYLPALELNLDIMSVISGNEIKVKSVELERPYINLIMTKGGKANWDIMKPTEEPATADTVPSNLDLALEGWEIKDGRIRYDDRSLPFLVDMRQVNHTGSGDFEQNVFDMESHTQAGNFTMSYGGVPYISKARLDADVTMGMDLDKSVYTFKENQVKLNDLALGFDGNVALPNATDVLLDLTFNAKETDFKNLLSVVPGMYAENFENVKTEGKMAFQGFLKGTSNETSVPGYGLDVQVSNAMFKYPDLPQAAKNISMDLSVRNPDGQDQSLAVNLKQFHMELGNNPIDARVNLQGLEPMNLDGNVKAKVNLQEMMQVFPMEGLTLRGLLAVDADAKGTYSPTQMPVVNAALNLTNGYVKSKDFPAPIEQLTVTSNISNATGQVNDTKVNIERFKMLLDGEPLEGRVYVQNIDQPQFDADIKGVLDLTKLTKMFPQEGMTLAGRIMADISTKGNMADIEAGRYGNVQSSGTMNISNLNFQSTDLPQGMKISSAAMAFNNEQIKVTNMSGNLGKSDFAANGTISNYMGYMFSENQPLKGNLTVNSNRFDVNEWMVEEPPLTPEVQVSNPDAGTMAKEAEGVVPVPADLDMTLNMSAGEVLYDNLNLQNVKGQVTIKDQIARLQNVTFNTLGGQFATSGSYNTQDLAHPKFTFDLDINSLEFKQAFEAFNTIKVMAPITRLLEGKFSTNLKLNGELGQDMMPVYPSLTGTGAVEVIRAVVNNVKVLDKMASLTKMQELQRLVVENKKFYIQIMGGNLVVKPFDLNLADKMNMTVGGQNSYTGGIDYLAALDVPTGKVGTALSDQIAGVKGLSNFKAAERVTLNFNIGGTLSDPKVSLAGGALKGQVKEAVKDAVQNIIKDRTDDAKQKLEAERAAAEQRAREEAEKQRQELEKKKQEAEQKAREELERKRKEAEEKAKKEAEDKLKGIFKR